MKRVLIIAFDGSATLDVTGPAEVFAAARDGSGRSAFRIEPVSVRGGDVRTSSGIVLSTRLLADVRPRATDTVVVSGGTEAATLIAMEDGALLAWIARAARIVERMTSVCSGAFILAAAGLLDGRRAATHWAGCERLAAMFPKVDVDPNAIFVRDGSVWTSAGVTTGIDMALAIVESELGASAADAVAAALVLYVRRPGFQSQFSEALVSQLEGSSPLASAVAWIRGNLRHADVERLARATSLSVRTLHRRCREHLMTTPAKLIERVRVEHARALIARGGRSTKRLAAQCGFGSATHLRRAFERELGVGPREYRLLHGRERAR